MMTTEDITRVKRGPADLEERIEQLIKQKESLKSGWREAGHRIEELERDREILKKEIDRLAEENSNFERMLRKWWIHFLKEYLVF